MQSALSLEGWGSHGRRSSCYENPRTTILGIFRIALPLGDGVEAKSLINLIIGKYGPRNWLYEVFFFFFLTKGQNLFMQTAQKIKSTKRPPNQKTFPLCSLKDVPNPKILL